MIPVAVVGAGQSAYGAFPERSLKALFHEAATDCLASVDKGIAPGDIGEAMIGTLSTGGAQLGNVAPLMMEAAGLEGVSAAHVENACASSGYAFRLAAIAVASGQVDVAVAAGVEKMTDLPRERNRLWLGISGDVEWERLAGTNFPGIYAMLTRRHMHEHGTPAEAIHAVAAKNRTHAVDNPKAQFRKAMTTEQAAAAPNLADPFTLADACGVTDGASMVVLARADIADRFTDRPVHVLGLGGASDYVAAHDRDSMSRLDAARKAARMAYAQAGIGPEAIRAAEVHDCFAGAELLAYGDLGFCDEAGAGRLALDGVTRRDGRLPVNNSGGLIGKGHPIGATGTGQVYELFHQLRGSAADPARQLDLGDGPVLAHNVGGSGGSVAVTVLGRARP